MTANGGNAPRGVAEEEGEEAFGQTIKRWRLERRLTQPALAQLCGIDQGFISQIETGRIKNASVDYLRKLARGFHMPFTEMLVAAKVLDGEDLIGEEMPYLDRYVQSLRHNPAILELLRQLDGEQYAGELWHDLAESLRIQLSAILRARDSVGGDGSPEG